MNYNKVIADINANPDKYDAVWQQNQDEFQMTGQGGVPTMSFKGEPFFGQDRFDQFFWRLRENGLTRNARCRESPSSQGRCAGQLGNRKRRPPVGELASSHPAGTG